jgi:hypothetical protein
VGPSAACGGFEAQALRGSLRSHLRRTAERLRTSTNEDIQRVTRFELATSTLRQSVALGATFDRGGTEVERMTRFELATSTVRQSVALGATRREVRVRRSLQSKWSG